MTALALATLLAVAPAGVAPPIGPGAVPPPTSPTVLHPAGGPGAMEELPDVAPDAPARPSRVRELRVGGGVLQLKDVKGNAAAAEVGTAIQLTEHLDLRLAFQTAMRMEWGYLGLAPELTYRVLPSARFSPFIGAGFLASAVTIREEALRNTRKAAAPLSVPVFMEGNFPGPLDGREGSGDPGASPLRASLGPQATVGLDVRLTRGFAVTLGGRYSSIRWEGKQYGGFAGYVGIVSGND